MYSVNGQTGHVVLTALDIGAASETDLDTTNENLTMLATDLGALEDGVVNLQARVGELDTIVNSSDTGLVARMDRADEAIDIHGRTIAEHTTKINTNSENISNNSVAIEACTTTLTTLANTVGTLSNTVTDHTAKLADHERRIKNLEPVCLAEDTLINMYNGTQKPIQDIVAGDIVLSYDVNTKQNTKAVVLMCEQSGSSRNFTSYAFDDGNYLIVRDHHGMYNPVLGRIVDLMQLKADYGISGRGLNIENSVINLGAKMPIKLKSGEQKRYFSIYTSNSLYYANNVLLGNSQHETIFACRLLDRFTPSQPIATLWQQHLARYSDYDSYLFNPKYYASVSAVYIAKAHAIEAIKHRKAKLASLDYFNDKLQEGAISEEEWREKIAPKAQLRKEINEYEENLVKLSAQLEQIRESYQGEFKTLRAVFEACSAEDNSAYNSYYSIFTKPKK